VNGDGKMIIGALQEDSTLRLSTGSRWMVWDEDDLEWVVYERKLYDRKTKVLVRTSSTSKALENLIGKEEA